MGAIGDALAAARADRMVGHDLAGMANDHAAGADRHLHRLPDQPPGHRVAVGVHVDGAVRLHPANQVPQLTEGRTAAKRAQRRRLARKAHGRQLTRGAVNTLVGDLPTPSGQMRFERCPTLESAAGDRTLIERSSRFAMLLHLPRPEGYQRGQRVKNGPPLAGHGAEAVRTAIVQSMSELPGTLRQSLTWDQGAEMAQHARLRIESGLEIYFCDPQSPWQRGSNENTNGLLRQYFPKGTDLSRHSTEELAAVAHAMNTRPRKTLGWKTPIELLDVFLAQQYDVRVATTG